MKYAIVFLLVASPVFAQSSQPDAGDLAADWQAVMTAQKHLADDLRQVVQENKTLKEENARLKASPVPGPETK